MENCSNFHWLASEFINTVPWLQRLLTHVSLSCGILGVLAGTYMVCTFVVAQSASQYLKLLNSHLSKSLGAI